jgi:hypothetical protein
MKTAIQHEVAKEVIKEISISPRGKRLVLIAMVIQIPLVWLPFVTQIITCILLGMALSNMKVIEKRKK